MPSAFFNDGYTRVDKIPATKRHPAVEITYRPMLRGERNSHILRNGKLIDKGGDAVDEASRKTAEALAARLVDWDITQELVVDGETKQVKVPINAANIGRLEPNLFETIFRAVCGYDDEKMDAEEKDPYAKADKAEAEAAGN